MSEDTRTGVAIRVYEEVMVETEKRLLLQDFIRYSAFCKDCHQDAAQMVQQMPNWTIRSGAQSTSDENIMVLACYLIYRLLQGSLDREGIAAIIQNKINKINYMLDL